ncbi:MAG: DUF697 domain-containing protein [Acidobacteria bacterium]|nr:DUF697 domain-containing protein [Acidobacteriota bacterium]
MSEKEPFALEIVKRHSLYAGVVGLVPVPLVNFAGVAAFEIKMLKDLAAFYEIPFREDAGKTIVSSLIGGLGATNLGYGALGLAKSVPLVGTLLGILTLPVSAAALTWAIGKVFIMHFESGGTLLDFDPDKVRGYFAEQLGKGKKTATA